ncbi:conserved hypothetical protein [Moraxellaceae bacterium 17A]|nr:conserved hypothetical protein [Moraxellaceae bacterium 17A]
MTNSIKLIKSIVQNTWVSALLGGLLVAYYTTLDVWGEKWWWIANFEDLHSTLYSSLMIITIIVLFSRAYFDYKDEKIENDNKLTLTRFITFIRNIVETKKSRFYNKATNIGLDKKRLNFFDLITQPEEQLKYIMRQSQSFFEYWGIPTNKLEITILGTAFTDTGNRNWKYILQLDEQRNHTNANEIMNGNSLAHQAMVSGEPIFLADLQQGIDDNVFLTSTRSNQVNNIGSIYCKPVTLKIQNLTYQYVFSIVSYGIYLCSPDNENEAEQMAMLLNEIGNRVELELYLHAMKKHRNSN